MIEWDDDNEFKVIDEPDSYDVIAQGNKNNLKSFAWNGEYERLFTNFEEWISAENLQIRNVKDLKDAVGSFLPRFQPKPRQMDLYSEYYKTSLAYTSPDEYGQIFEFKQSIYGRSQTKTGKGILIKHPPDKAKKMYDVEEVIYHLKYGDRIILRDVKTKVILKHLKDVKGDRYLTGDIT